MYLPCALQVFRLADRIPMLPPHGKVMVYLGLKKVRLAKGAAKCRAMANVSLVSVPVVLLCAKRWSRYMPLPSLIAPLKVKKSLRRCGVLVVSVLITPCMGLSGLQLTPMSPPVPLSAVLLLVIISITVLFM